MLQGWMFNGAKQPDDTFLRMDFQSEIRESARIMLEYWYQRLPEGKAKIDSLRHDFPSRYMEDWLDKKVGMTAWGQRGWDSMGLPTQQAPLPQPKTTEATPRRVRRFAAVTTGNDVKIAFSADGGRIAVANANPTLIMQVGGTSRVSGDWKPSADVLDAETGKIVVSLMLTTADEDAVLAATEQSPTLKQRLSRFRRMAVWLPSAPALVRSDCSTRGLAS